jgi:POT family proton-dependent oligopeptide transporter
VQQATMMDLEFKLPWIGSFQVTPDQMQALNPILVMLLIPITSFGLYPLIEKFGFKMTPLRRMSLGMLVASFAFVAIAVIQGWIDQASVTQGPKIHVGWQLLPYVIITISEVMVSITGLEFAYTQAPKRMKSTIMGCWLLTVTVGNVLVAVLARFSQLALADFFWVFTGFMAGAAILFSVRAYFYQPKEYLY